MNKRQPSISSDPPVIEQLKREKAQSDREVSRLQRELELVKGKTGGKIQSLEEALERSSLSLGQATADLEKTSKSNAKLQEELSLLQDSVIDQQYEIASLKSRQKAIDSELARKDKDAAQLLAAVRRYKSRLDYLKSKLRRNRRASKSDEENIDVNASYAPSYGDESPYNSVITNGTSSIGVRRDSIQFPGYMTAEEEYFRLVVLAAKLNISGTSTPTCADDSASQFVDESHVEEQMDPEIDPAFMYAKVKADEVPFHKWHEWAQEYVMSRHMPSLMGVDSSYYSASGERRVKKQGFARRVMSKALSKLLGRSSKRKSIGIAVEAV